MKQSPWIAEGRKNQPDMPSKGLVELSTMFNGSTLALFPGPAQSLFAGPTQGNPPGAHADQG